MSTAPGWCLGWAGCPLSPLIPHIPRRSLALWGLTKKKPLTLARQAHGEQDAQGLQQPYWISAVAALRNSDLLATGVWQLLLAACGGSVSCSHPWAGLRDSLLSVPQGPTAAA